MKYLDEFGDAELAKRLLDDIAESTTQNWALMEVCGGQTHTIIRNGIDQLLPDQIELIHGPGCPVCVTPLETIDRALAIAARPDVIFCSFGDMIRVPGSSDDLFRIKSRGGDIRIVYSPLDAVKIAQENPDKQVVFFGVGFETTAPANAMTVKLAKQQGIDNFSLLVSHVLVPPAIRAIMDSPSARVQGFLAAGHVCTVMGLSEYEPLVEQYQVPIVATGFEPPDVLEGIRRVVLQLEQGRADYDAEKRFEVLGITTVESPLCRSGEVLQGLIKPNECSAFGKECTPRSPLGAPMVSSEGACAAYYQFRRLEVSA